MTTQPSETTTTTMTTTLEARIALYNKHKDTTLREMIAVDHFSNAVPPSIVDMWLLALDPDPLRVRAFRLPPEIKGFYGGDLRASIPIELAHDCYKYIVHETEDREKVARYAGRMLLAIGLLDLERLEVQDVDLAGLALWHKALALARVVGNEAASGDVVWEEMEGPELLAKTLHRYELVRAKSKLPDSKLPQPQRLKTRLLASAQGLQNEKASAVLEAWTAGN